MVYRKYHNRKVVFAGHNFDSQAEANRYQELVLLQRAGKIKELELQPRFLIQEEFTYQGKKERKIEYVADFMYKEFVDKDCMMVRTVVEDVKGMKTDVYKLKRKLFLARYPLIDFREIM